MKQIFKRVLPLLLALVLVLSMVPGFAVEADAATTKDFTGCTVDGLGLSATNANGSGTPSCSWTASGTTMSGSLVGGKDETGFRKYYYESTSTLTLTNQKSVEAELSFKYSVTTSGSKYGDITVNGTKHTSSAENQSVKVTLAPQGTVTIQLHVPQRTGYGSLPAPNGASISIRDLALTVNNIVAVNFGTATNGTYTVKKADGTAVDTSTTMSTLSTDRYSLTATPASGYVFAGWYYTLEDGTETFFSGVQNAVDRLFDKNGTLVPKFMPVGQGLWAVGDAEFTAFSQASAAAQASGDPAVLLKDYTLTEDLSIPAGVTVLIPFDDAHTVGGADPEVMEHITGYSSPYLVYRTLTIQNGVTMTVNGNLEVGAKHLASHGGQIVGGTPYDYYGKIVMENGSAIQVNRGGNLYAWGYITGTDAAIAAGNVTATVTAKNGGKIYEKMQVSDYRGGKITSAIVLRKCFPFNQYYIQNVEVREVLEYGANLIAHAGIYGDGVESSSISFMGTSGSMFVLGEGTSITKYYDHKTDRLIVDAEGDISMNAISIMGYDTSEYILPFNHNITININSGTATLNQDIMFQPGATANVAEGAKLVLASGKKAILMDNDGWGNYCFAKQLQQISYVPYYKGAPRIRQANDANGAPIGAPINMGDATINVNGTFEVNGTLYASGSGAKIISSDETGVINFKAAAATGNITFKQSTVAGYTFGGNTVDVTVNPGKLTNGEGVEPATVDTKGITANTVYNYCATCDMWVNHITVSFDANGGTGTMASLTTHAGCKGSLPKSTFTAPLGKVFANWNTEATPTEETPGIAYADEAVISDTGITGSVTLYAQWKGLKGDVDLDGFVKASDATALARHLAKIETITDPLALNNADTNSDGTVGAADATKMARYLAKIITDWDQE